VVLQGFSLKNHKACETTNRVGEISQCTEKVRVMCNSFKKNPCGPDPDFPYLCETERFRFPSAMNARGGIVAAGGNLSPGMLLSAYENGIFPWYNDGEPIMWHSPESRFVLFPEKLHVSKSMRKIIRQKRFEIRYDYDFEAVIKNCAAAARRGQDGTWITKDMIAAYIKMHELKYAHCAEAYENGVLAGGCYGLLLKDVFFGESMFALKPNASKAAFISLAKKLFGAGFGVRFIDCQVYTNHLESLGAVEIPRLEFLDMLKAKLSLKPQVATPAFW
jgi:leucyl/phenylalanyl-tRNA--protein transferase